MTAAVQQNVAPGSASRAARGGGSWEEARRRASKAALAAWPSAPVEAAVRRTETHDEADGRALDETERA